MAISPEGSNVKCIVRQPRYKSMYRRVRGRDIDYGRWLQKQWSLVALNTSKFGRLDRPRAMHMCGDLKLVGAITLSVGCFSEPPGTLLRVTD